MHNYVSDAERINVRNTGVKLRGKVGVDIISAYAPNPSDKTYQFYKRLDGNYRKRSRRGITVIGADMNIKFKEGGDAQ